MRVPVDAPAFANIGIEIPTGAHGEIDVLCPQCSHTRRKRALRCLSVNTIDGAWLCHHCHWAGRLGTGDRNYGAPLRQRIGGRPPPRVYVSPKLPHVRALPSEVVAWFANRHIPQSILIATGITAGWEFCPQLRRDVLAIRFPYLLDGRLINIKYRAILEKLFWMVKGAQRILYGLDDILDAETICIVEGEIDALSIRAAGGPPTLSVPDGAPPATAKNYASKFNFLDPTAFEKLRQATTILIGADMDPPGMRLADELAQRIGFSRCKRISWHPFKDANELLVAQGLRAVLDALAAAEPFPVPPRALGTASRRLRVRQASRA